MTKFGLLSAAAIAATMLAAPAIAREGHAMSRHVTEQANTNTGFGDSRVCIPAPRVAAFATAPWTGSNVPCEPPSQF
jgi:hypothetical protein